MTDQDTVRDESDATAREPWSRPTLTRLRTPWAEGGVNSIPEANNGILES